MKNAQQWRGNKTTKSASWKQSDRAKRIAAAIGYCDAEMVEGLKQYETNTFPIRGNTKASKEEIIAIFKDEYVKYHVDRIFSVIE